MCGEGLWKGIRTMTREEFMKSTTKLQELFHRSFNDTQLDFWFDELKGYDIEKYKRAIGDYARKSRTLPALSDILQAIRNLKPQGTEQQQAEVKKVHCDTCHGSGLVKYILDGYEYLCKCFCENGKKYDGMELLRNYKDVFYYRVPKNDVVPLDVDISQINF